MMKKTLCSLGVSTWIAAALFAGGGGDIFRASVTADNLEYRFNDAQTLYWDAYGFAGYDLNKVYFYSEGEQTREGDAGSENQLLYSRAIAPFWDIQAGVDYDVAGSENRTWGVAALSGLAPYFFEARAALLFSDSGNVGLRVDLEYEALITQKLILTPKFTLDAYTKDDLKMGRGKGVSDFTLGARLRYEIRREFAPYSGAEWAKNLGTTNDIAALDEVYITAGIRIWF